MGKADGLSRRPDWQEEVEKDNEDQTLIKPKWVRGAEMLSQSLDDLGITLGECLGRTQWSSLLDLTTYLYYFTSGCTPITT